MRPAVVVSDILTLAPTLAAEAAGVPLATLIPHIYPVVEPGLPFFAVGLRTPRTPFGRAVWRAGTPGARGRAGARPTRPNAQRERLDLPPLDRFHGGICDRAGAGRHLSAARVPARAGPPAVEVTGPMAFEVPHPAIELPPGEAPLVLVAPSTAHDPENQLVRTALAALAEEPVRVVADHQPGRPRAPIEVPANAVLVDWLSYTS